MKKTQHTQQATRDLAGWATSTQIAETYKVSPRYILQLAAEGKIPCLRLGRKCVRFDSTKVAAAINSFIS